MGGVGLQADNIQGNITPGFRSPQQAFLLARLPDNAASARAWLYELQPEVTSARQVQTFFEARSQAGPASRSMRATWVNVAFSWQGLERLNARSIEAFPGDFRQGLFARAEQVSDDLNDRAGWELGGTQEKEPHALVVVAAATRRDLDREVERQKARLASHGVVEGEQLKIYTGQKLSGALREHEHFGFRDGLSQPTVDRSELGDVVAAGEFILGYPDEHGETILSGPPWARDGSFAVFRKIRQHVFRFREVVAREAQRADISPEQLAAKLVGRWPSGAKLGDEATDPGWSERRGRVQAIDFAKDPAGERCPRFAHIRKAHPRDLTSRKPWRHRLIRRGIPYGDPLPLDASEDDGRDRGLLFLAYQASLSRQFEHVQQRWSNSRGFPRPGDGLDPLIGQTDGPRQVKLRKKGASVRLSLDSFVSVSGGGYFFAPSIRALAYLADPTRPWIDEEKEMPYEGYQGLAQLMSEENPYGSDGELPDDLDEATARDPRVNWWYFDGKPRRVAKAIRIPYTYVRNGQKLTDHLLIGFEGQGH
jgi:Dyp-type peroxidase family